MVSTSPRSTSSNPSSSLQDDYPWTQKPLIVSAPMAGFATASLATAVSMNGGIGLIGSVADMEALARELTTAWKTLADAGIMQQPQNETQTFPIGIGLLLFISPLREAVEVIRKHHPAIVWLSFAREMSDFSIWAKAIRVASPQTKIWIQVGTVSTALDVVASAQPDVLVMQGSDAGGHGFERSAGIVSLVPETLDALEHAGYGHVPVFAAGGIVDGRGIVAALSLGAKGVVMGTRFLASTECVIPHPCYRDAIIKTRDGGSATVRAKVFDELRGPNIWPEAYDGRAIRNDSWHDMKKCAEIANIRKRYAEALKGQDAGYGEGTNGRTTIWAGSGVGLVNSVQSTDTIMKEARNVAIKALEGARAYL